MPRCLVVCAGAYTGIVRCRYIDNMTSERVDAQGVTNIAKAAKQFLPAQPFQPEVEQVLSMQSKEDLEVWEKLDDTIMGGKSGSFLQTAKELHGFKGDYQHQAGQYEFEGSVWRGEVNPDGGGFCGARTKVGLPNFLMAPKTRLLLARKSCSSA